MPQILILFISFYLMVIFPLTIWPTAQSLCRSLSTEDNNFIRAVTSGRLPDETAKMPLSNIANTVAKLHGLGILMHDNAWHPQILWYLMRNDTNSLKTIMRMQAEVGAERRMVRLANEIFPYGNLLRSGNISD